MPRELSLKEKNLKEIDPRNHGEYSSGWSFVMKKRLEEGAFILIFAVSLFLLLALVSYEKNDPNWFGQDRISETISNSGGWVGAYLADGLFAFLGFLAYGVPVLMVYLAWLRLYPERYEMLEERVSNKIRLIGAMLLVLGLSGLISFEFFVPASILPHTAGGFLGDIFSKGLDMAFNPKGTVLLLSALCFIGITLLTGLSWISATEVIGFHVLCWVEKISVVACKLFLALQEKAQLGYKKIKQKVVDHINSKKINQKSAAAFDKMDVNLLDNTPKNETTGNGMDSLVRKTPSINIEAVSELSASVKSPKITLGSTFATAAPLNRVPSGVKEAQETPPKTTQRSNPQPFSPSLNKEPLHSLPSLDLLEPAEKSSGKGYSSEQLEFMAREVEQRLLDFGIEVQVVAVNPGPVITRFELQLAAGLKVSRIVGLAKDLARSLSVTSVRVVDVIPGKPVIGLELPNKHREMVRLSEVFLTEQFQQARSPISMALGVDISGYPVVVDLAKMPHLLVAGTTGSGKSVGLNAMLLSILFKATPDEVRLILVDPKMLEFSIYDRIPHLLTPVVTDMKEAAGALRWSVAEMERRYRLMSIIGVRNLAAYNNTIKESIQKGEPIKDPLWKATQNMEEVAPYLEPLPYIVVVIDELADMMMVVGKKVEQLIARIAQKARAAGIHLILATQRPSVDVLTGLIKSNIPTRIAFQVSSKIDSRTILDQQGADQLLGHGDMLYLTPGSGSPVRIHGAFVDDKEVHRVTEAWRQRGDPQYVDVILKSADGNGDGDIFGEGNAESAEDADPLYDEAVRFVTETRKASISSVQRRLKVGYNRAARLIEEMERTGVVSSMESNGVRDVLAPPPPED